MRKNVVLLLVVFLAAAAPLLAANVPLETLQDIPGVLPADFAAESPAAHWIWTVLASEIVVMVFAYAVAFLVDRIKNEKIRKGVLVIKSAVAACYHEYVRVVKERSADGKLTVEEKNEALQYAYAKAIDFARNEGIDLLKVFAKETVMWLIEKFVGEAKGTNIPAPLSALAPSLSSGV